MFYRVLKYIMLHFAPLITSFGTVRFRIYLYTIVVYIRMHISLIKRWGYRTTREGSRDHMYIQSNDGKRRGQS